MKALLDAIYSRFQGSSLDSALGGQLYLDEAPQHTLLPYAVFSLPSGVTEFTFTETRERVLIQFDLYADSNAAVCDLYEELKALFDDCTLDVAGHLFLKMERAAYQKLKGPHHWRYIVEYHVWLEKT